jgi:hypothetical protein
LWFNITGLQARTAVRACRFVSVPSGARPCAIVANNSMAGRPGRPSGHWLIYFLRFLTSPLLQFEKYKKDWGWKFDARTAVRAYKHQIRFFIFAHSRAPYSQITQSGGSGRP